MASLSSTQTLTQEEGHDSSDLTVKQRLTLTQTPTSENEQESLNQEDEQHRTQTPTSEDEQQSLDQEDEQLGTQNPPPDKATDGSPGRKDKQPRTQTQTPTPEKGAEESSGQKVKQRRTQTEQTMTPEEAQEFLDREVKRHAKKAVDSSGPFWSAVEKFLAWVRRLFKNLLYDQLTKLPVVGQWAGRIGSTVSDLTFTVIGTTLHSLKIVFTSSQIWSKAHQAAMAAWTSNETNGLLAQTYAYSKKMTAYFLEIVKQCLERAIVTHGLEVSEDEKARISDALDELLQEVK